MTRARALRLAGKGMGTAAGIYGLRLLRRTAAGSYGGLSSLWPLPGTRVGVEVVLI